MKKQSFLQGALILMLAGLFNRIIGFVLRLIIIRIVGDEGLGLFQMVYPLFLTLLLICTAGFPVAISKLIPERLAIGDIRGVFSLFKITLLFTCFMSIIISVLIYLNAQNIAIYIYNNEQIYFILLAIIPALIFSSLAASFRGFFQGMHNMLPTALSQTTEQLSRSLATLVIINMVAYLGLKYQAAGIAMGISIGEFSGLMVLLILFISSYISPLSFIKGLFSKVRYHNYSKARFFYHFKTIAVLAIPITLGRLVNSLMLSGEAVLIPRQLQLIGLSSREATSLYGQLSGMVEQLIFLPTVITIALTISLVPNISDAYARHDLNRVRSNYQDVIRITSYLGLPVAVIFFTMGREICQMLFGYPEAGNILAIMSLYAVFIYYLQVSYGMLNGLGKPQLALLNLIIGSFFKLSAIYYLTKIPNLGIKGAAIGIGIGYILSSLLNFIAIGHNIGYKIDLIQCLLKPISVSALLYLIQPRIAIIINMIPYQIDFRLEIISILILLLIIYLLAMINIGAITSKDINRFRKS